MKRIIWTLAILFFSIAQHAQVPEINWGEKNTRKAFGKYINQRPLGYTNEYIFMRNKTKEVEELIQYDFANNFIKSIPLNFDFKGKEVHVYKIINTLSGNYLLGSNYDKKLNKTFIHAAPISEGDHIPTSLKSIYVFDYKKHKVWATDDKHNQDQIEIQLSPDSTKVLFTNVTSNKDHRKQKYKDEYVINVFNDKLEKLWEKKIDFSVADKDMIISQSQISNDGDVFILVKEKSKEKRSKWCPSFDYSFLKVTSNGDIEKIKIKIENAYPKHAKLSIDQDGNCYLIGYFTEKEKRDVFRFEHGIFFHKYDSNGYLVLQKKHKWEKEFYVKLKEEYNLDKESSGADGFYIDGISIDYLQNSISLISTHRYQTFGNSNNGGKTTTSRYNYANHVIISSFDFDANLNWTSCLEKKSNPMSFLSNMIFGCYNGNIYLIFNASKKLGERREAGVKKKYSTRFTDFARINSNGEIDVHKTIFNSQETGVYFYPQNSSFIEKGIFLLFGRDNKNARLGLMKLSE
ncbi:hypothetical protein OAU10_01345 [Saprospiraceae bacterium]|nr:hypothetical protein [Saprospiraceae bacterium]